MGEDIQWVMPIIYSNVLPDPLKYDKSGPKEGIIGILALGIVQLPEYGDSGEVEIESGSAAFFLESDSVVYRPCGGFSATGQTYSKCPEYPSPPWPEPRCWESVL